ncbi:hypothetical protein PHYBLDRAFT_70602 [Phycomyces blakesleeanus NRRL 1555(-)]|uniref:Uncharacterized protein n=1 Tax=Phycomyces blakesleeanus (strain ATCC 8743b / DSM 1359 / FGSC 10004 / NBRC 33097 / NRRL 1555) TaxID=763407 RepID=A0A167LHL2_PHYB8|nr:hypothetical protein PHYBLDRAFT_70602 [Phycomyces blakesleeanus NRRL 1555(-)]OAD70477.1 hypothetical protein PHYBLDRAFT_70602 [Phycomyces blakesleeanus NRRL 1555(-)]|eukprot:XP_018288517.1 hypothetical protein PHYBLDRAFT_70602 [Phycomyces blakesleeanus NRRL 1555(-)]
MGGAIKVLVIQILAVNRNSRNAALSSTIAVRHISIIKNDSVEYPGHPQKLQGVQSIEYWVLGNDEEDLLKICKWLRIYPGQARQIILSSRYISFSFYREREALSSNELYDIENVHRSNSYAHQQKYFC